MGETPSFVPLPGSRPLLIEALRRRRRTDSTPRAPPRTPVRDALSSWRDHLAAIDVSRSRALHLLTETGGPFAGDGWCVHHHRRGFVTRSVLTTEPLRAPSPSRERPLLRECRASLSRGDGPEMRAADFCSSTDSETGTHRIVWRPSLPSTHARPQRLC
jgi:hypothetical protein